MKKLFPIIFLTLLIVGIGCPNPDVEECLRDLKSHNLVTKREAIYRIGELKITEAIPDLVSLLNQDLGEISVDIIDVLGKIGDSAAVEPLIAKLNEDNPLIREKAIEALGKIRDKRAVPALASILEQKDSRTDREILIATWALGNIGDKSAEHILNSLLKDKDRYVRYNVEQALKKIPTAETESIETSHPPQKDKIPRAEETTQSPKRIESLLLAAKEKERMERSLLIAKEKEEMTNTLKKEVDNTSLSPWVVEVCSFLHHNEARNLARIFNDQGFPAFVSRTDLKGQRWYRVRVGVYSTREEAQKMRERIANEFDITDPWIHLLDTQTQHKMVGTLHPPQKDKIPQAEETARSSKSKVKAGETGTKIIETLSASKENHMSQTEEPAQSPESNEENVNNNELSPQPRQSSKPKIMKKEERTPTNDANIPGTRSIKRPPARAKSKKPAKTEPSQSREEKAKTGKPTPKSGLLPQGEMRKKEKDTEVEDKSIGEAKSESTYALLTASKTKERYFRGNNSLPDSVKANTKRPITKSTGKETPATKADTFAKARQATKDQRPTSKSTLLSQAWLMDEMSSYTIHVVFQAQNELAKETACRLQRLGYPVYIRKMGIPEKNSFHGVFVGGFQSESEAIEAARKLREEHSLSCVRVLPSSYVLR